MSTPANSPPLFDLVQKYNRPGPRYTSYPPAPHFTKDFGADDFRAKLMQIRPGDGAEDNGEGGLSIYVHLPFCRSLCFYCGCHMLVTGRAERIEEYLRYLKMEVDLVASLVDPSNRVVQVHWGGGTPTYLAPGQIVGLMDHLRSRFEFASDAEISIEGDPRGLKASHLEAARMAGFTRLSLGVQDFDPRVQQAVNREQSVEMVREATETARDLGFDGVSYDLIYGLPHQTVESFSETVREVLALAPDRISLFGYAHVPWKKKHQRVIRDDWLPSSSEKIQIFLEAERMLTAQGGYRYIGMDHFAKPGDPLLKALDEGTLQRNFQGYSTHAGTDLVGFGVSSISRVLDAYAQNVLDLRDYYDSLEAETLPTARGYRMTRDDRIREAVISKLMCNLSLDVPAVERRFEIDFWTYFEDALRDLDAMASDGLVEFEPDAVRVTETGRFFIRNVAMAFDAYLKTSAAKRPMYSTTV